MKQSAFPRMLKASRHKTVRTPIDLRLRMRRNCRNKRRNNVSPSQLSWRFLMYARAFSFKTRRLQSNRLRFLARLVNSEAVVQHTVSQPDRPHAVRGSAMQQHGRLLRIGEHSERGVKNRVGERGRRARIQTDGIRGRAVPPFQLRPIELRPLDAA